MADYKENREIGNWQYENPEDQTEDDKELQKLVDAAREGDEEDRDSLLEFLKNLF